MGSEGAEPKEGDIVSGGGGPPAVMGEVREETLSQAPADQRCSPHCSDWWTAAPCGQQGGATPS